MDLGSLKWSVLGKDLASACHSFMIYCVHIRLFNWSIMKYLLYAGKCAVVTLLISEWQSQNEGILCSTVKEGETKASGLSMTLTWNKEVDNVHVRLVIRKTKRRVMIHDLKYGNWQLSSSRICDQVPTIPIHHITINHSCTTTWEDFFFDPIPRRSRRLQFRENKISADA